MNSRTEKGNTVRDYFLQLRKHINYYRNKFAEKINSLVEKGKGVYIMLLNKNKIMWIYTTSCLQTLGKKLWYLVVYYIFNE